MTTIVREIHGDDYSASGNASKAVKETLKRIGAAPAIIRRAMVAVYEAEMNVVIHANTGTMRARITPERLEVSFEDQGPGIPDIGQAMREGFSTAPAEARALGFGAGMGLPNIRKNTDRFSIQSDPGKGTRLRFSLALQSQPDAAPPPISLRVDAGNCIQCMRCLAVCPTSAIRVRNGAPMVLPHLCVNCTSCAGVCPAGVFGIDCDATLPEGLAETVLIAPPALRGQFGFAPMPGSVEDALRASGWADVSFLDPWERALDEAVRNYFDAHTAVRPLLSPVCPAVLTLIRTRYPSLIEHIAPYLTAAEAVVEAQSDRRCVFAAPCPAQCAAALDAGQAGVVTVVTAGLLIRELAPRLKAKSDGHSTVSPPSAGESPLTVYGMERVCQFLDEAENGQMNDCAIVELYACDLGCYGAPVWAEAPAAARQRAASAGSGTSVTIAEAVYRARPLEGRPGLRLDADMRAAMKKLAEIDRLAKALPGRDCGACGSPSCMALAEDIVLGRGRIEDCIYYKQDGADGLLSPDKEKQQ